MVNSQTHQMSRYCTKKKEKKMQVALLRLCCTVACCCDSLMSACCWTFAGPWLFDGQLNKLVACLSVSFCCCTFLLLFTLSHFIVRGFLNNAVSPRGVHAGATCEQSPQCGGEQCQRYPVWHPLAVPSSRQAYSTVFPKREDGDDQCSHWWLLLLAIREPEYRFSGT